MPPPERHPGARATPATGAGAAAAATLGRRASAPFPVPPPPPKWAPPPAHRAVPKTAAAALDLELARVRSLSKLRKRLEASCGRGGLSLNGSGLLTFERYLWAARAETGVVAARVRPPRGHEDAVLPPTARAGVAALAADLCRRGADKEQAQTAAADLGAAAAAAATKLAARARALSTGATPQGHRPGTETTWTVRARLGRRPRRGRGTAWFFGERGLRSKGRHRESEAKEYKHNSARRFSPRRPPSHTRISPRAPVNLTRSTHAHLHTWRPC